jgi:hypothetical protein
MSDFQIMQNIFGMVALTAGCILVVQLWFYIEKWRSKK